MYREAVLRLDVLLLQIVIPSAIKTIKHYYKCSWSNGQYKLPIFVFIYFGVKYSRLTSAMMQCCHDKKSLVYVQQRLEVSPLSKLPIFMILNQWLITRYLRTPTKIMLTIINMGAIFKHFLGIKSIFC